MERIARPLAQTPLLAHVRAGLLASGGALLGLAAVGLVQEIGGRGRYAMWLWFALALVSAGIGLRFGHHAPARPRWHLLGRAASVLGVGGSLLAGAMFLLAWATSSSARAPFVLALPLGGGLVLLAISLRPRGPIEADIEELPPVAAEGGLLPPADEVGDPGRAFALLASGPALRDGECERDAPCVEVRALWGGDLLRVFHLDPPRSFRLGDDLPVDPSLLGAPCWPLVLVDDAGPAVLAPPCASGIVEASGERHAGLDRAVSAGAAIAAGDAIRVPLRPGDRVVLTLPGVGGVAYRAAGDQDGPRREPLVLEIALVRAGERVGRDLRFGDGQRLLLATALAGVAALALLHTSAPRADLPAREREPSSEQIRFMQEALVAYADREMEEHGEESPHPTTRWVGVRYGWSDSHWNFNLDGSDPFDDEPIAAFSPTLYADSCAHRLDGPWLGKNALFCSTEVATPFGLRRLEPHAPPDGVPDPLGRDRGDTWPFQNRAILLSTPPRSTGKLRLSGRVIQRAGLPPYPPEAALRLARAHRGRLRLCHADAIQRSSSLAGMVTLRALLGHDGVLSMVYVGSHNLTDSEFILCMRGAFAGARLARPEDFVVTLEMTIEMAP
jgi:hypothetical protein